MPPPNISLGIRTIMSLRQLKRSSYQITTIATTIKKLLSALYLFV